MEATASVRGPPRHFLCQSNPMSTQGLNRPAALGATAAPNPLKPPHSTGPWRLCPLFIITGMTEAKPASARPDTGFPMGVAEAVLPWAPTRPRAPQKPLLLSSTEELLLLRLHMGRWPDCSTMPQMSQADIPAHTAHCTSTPQEPRLWCLTFLRTHFPSISDHDIPEVSTVSCSPLTW